MGWPPNVRAMTVQAAVRNVEQGVETRAHREETAVTSLPLHPALVHLPLGLAFVLPFLALGVAWALWSDRLPRRAWIAVVALQAVLLAAGLAAMQTGEHEEDRVERIVPEAAMEQHEAYAEQFVWATGLTLALATLVLVTRRRALARSLTIASVAGTVLVAGAALRVGHAGGRLVYVHNAGAAYAPAQQTSHDASARPTAKRASAPTDDDD
jgi:uncharacterized membrane protein